MVYLGRFFFVVQDMGPDGVIQISADPIRSAIFHGVLFLVVLFVGGLWAFRNMTKTEIVYQKIHVSIQKNLSNRCNENVTIQNFSSSSHNFLLFFRIVPCSKD